MNINNDGEWMTLETRFMYYIWWWECKKLWKYIESKYITNDMEYNKIVNHQEWTFPSIQMKNSIRRANILSSEENICMNINNDVEWTILEASFLYYIWWWEWEKL